jgi:hypothetical protein
MTKLPTYYPGDDIPITRGPFTDDTGIPFDLSTMSQIVFKTGTDPRFVAEFALHPIGEQRGITLSDLVLNGTTYPNALAEFTIQTDQTLKMKVGYGTMEDFISQADGTLLDSKRDSSGENIVYQIIEHTL